MPCVHCRQGFRFLIAQRLASRHSAVQEVPRSRQTCTCWRRNGSTALGRVQLNWHDDESDVACRKFEREHLVTLSPRAGRNQEGVDDMSWRGSICRQSSHVYNLYFEHANGGLPGVDPRPKSSLSRSLASRLRTRQQERLGPSRSRVRANKRFVWVRQDKERIESDDRPDARAMDMFSDPFQCSQQV